MTGGDFQWVVYGFSAGLLFALAAVISGWSQRRTQQKELDRLRSHLHTQMEISHEGSDKLKTDLEELRRQNENLRLTVQTWQQKPGRAEQRNLQIYDRAVRSILASTPGFSMAWESALQKAERDVASADQGLIAFAKRLILPAKGSIEELPRGTVSDDDKHEL